MNDKTVGAASAASGIVVALLAIVEAFGVHLTPDQVAAVQALVGALLVVVGAWVHPSVPIGRQTPEPPK